MAFEGLAEKLNAAFKKLRSKGKLSENDVKEAMREVRLALLEADVNYKVAKDFVKKVTEKAVGEEVLSSLTPAQHGRGYGVLTNRDIARIDGSTLGILVLCRHHTLDRQRIRFHLDRSALWLQFWVDGM